VLTDVSPQVVFDNPLPEGVLCGLIFVNRGRIRIGIDVGGFVTNTLQGILFRAGEAIFLSSVPAILTVKLFKDGTKSESDHGDNPPDQECKIAEVTVSYLSTTPVLV
jgi:hypothetical protein